MSDKQRIYDTIFSLVEEELYQRLSPTGFKDSTYDGTKSSICGSSNLDFSDNLDDSILIGGYGYEYGKKSNSNSNRLIPGKFDVVRYSNILPLNVAIKGSIERQKLFIKEHKQKYEN
jgi:hypothetical protein